MDVWYKIKLYLKTNLDFFVKSTERIFMNIYKKKKKRILYERERERERTLLLVKLFQNYSHC